MSTITIGIDIGSGAVKTTLFRSDGDHHEWLAKRCERIRRRDPMTLAQEGHDGVLAAARADGRPRTVHEAVEPDVVGPLQGEDAGPAAELGDGLVGDGTSGTGHPGRIPTGRGLNRARRA